MKLKVFHKTVYHYTEPIKRSIQIIRLTPLSSGHQQVINWQVSLPTITIPSQDCFGNQTHCLIVDTPVSQIEIIAEGLIETFIAAPNPWLGKVPLEYYLNYTPLTSPSSEIINFIKLSLDSNEKFFIAPFDLSIILELLHQLSAKILARVGYQSGTTNATTTAAQAFVNGAGV